MPEEYVLTGLVGELLELGEVDDLVQVLVDVVARDAEHAAFR